MAAVNPIDRHIYDFEEIVFKEAAEHGLGNRSHEDPRWLTRGRSDSFRKPHYEKAVRYTLGIPGLSVAIMGMQSVSELRQAVATVRAYAPLEGGELSETLAAGKRMAAELGEHRGPVV